LSVFNEALIFLHFVLSRTGVMRPKIAATLEGVNTNQLYKGPQAKLKKRPPKVRNLALLGAQFLMEILHNWISVCIFLMEVSIAMKAS